MTEIEHVRVVHREVVQGDGAQKQKPIDKKPKEDSLLAGMSNDEKAIFEEINQPQTQTPLEKTDAPLIAAPASIKVLTEIIEKSEVLEKPTQTVLAIPRSIEQSNLESILPGYKCTERGFGGVGRVYAAIDSTGKDFAFKTINREVANATDNPDALHTFKKLLQEEASTINELAKTGSKHFLPFAIDLSVLNPDNPGFLTRFIPGSLEDKIKKGIPAKEALSYTIQSIKAIKLFHEKIGVLADIKPSQFRIDESDNLVLVDYNLKYAMNTDLGTDIGTMIHSGAHSLANSPSKIHGTPRFMAPEQLNRLEGNETALIDETTDVYQLGSMAYEIITGEKPEGSYENIQGELAPLNKIILKARSRKQKDRYQSVEEMLEDIKKAFPSSQQRAQNVSTVSSQATDSDLTIDGLHVFDLDDIDLEETDLEETDSENKNRDIEPRTSETLRETSNILGRGLSNIAKHLGHALASPLFFPTVSRRCRETKSYQTTSLIGATSGIAFSIFNLSNLFGAYPSMPYSPEILTTLLTTNLLSGIYELYHHAKNKVKERKVEGLEQKVETLPAQAKETRRLTPPEEPFILHGDDEYSRELVAKTNERMKGHFKLKAKKGKPVGYISPLARFAFVSTIHNDPILRSAGVWPISPEQSEELIKQNKLPFSGEYDERLGLIFYNCDSYLKDHVFKIYNLIINNKQELNLPESTQDIFSVPLIISNLGYKIDKTGCPNYIVVPSITQVYQHPILSSISEWHARPHKFDSTSSKRGLPTAINEKFGMREITLSSPEVNNGLIVVSRSADLSLKCKDNLENELGNTGYLDFATFAKPIPAQ